MFKYSKAMKTALGLGTLGYVLMPFLMMALMFLIIFGSIFLLANESGDPGPIILLPFLIQLLIIPFSLLLWVVHIFLIVAFVAHAVRFTAGSELVRILGLSACLLVPYLGMIFYYIVFILMDPPLSWALAAEEAPDD